MWALGDFDGKYETFVADLRNNREIHVLWLNEVKQMMKHFEQPTSIEKKMASEVRQFYTRSSTKALLENMMFKGVTDTPNCMVKKFLKRVPKSAKVQFTEEAIKHRFLHMTDQLLIYGCKVLENKSGRDKFDYFMYNMEWDERGVIDESQFWDDCISDSVLIKGFKRNWSGVENIPCYLDRLPPDGLKSLMEKYWCEEIQSWINEDCEMADYRKMMAANISSMDADIVLLLYSMDLYDDFSFKYWWNRIDPIEREEPLKLICKMYETYGYGRIINVSRKNYNSRAIIEIILYLLRDIDDSETITRIVGRTFLLLIISMWHRFEYHAKIPSVVKIYVKFMDDIIISLLWKFLDKTTDRAAPQGLQRANLLQEITKIASDNGLLITK